MKPSALHDLDCPTCGVVEDAFVEIASIHDNTATCECGTAGAQIIWTKAATTIGIVWSGRNGVQTHDQIGQTWHTNADRRAWEKAHPNLGQVDKGSPEGQAFHQRIRDRAEKIARGIGYRDLDHRRATEAATRAKGHDPKLLYPDSATSRTAPAASTAPPVGPKGERFYGPEAVSAARRRGVKC